MTRTPRQYVKSAQRVNAAGRSLEIAAGLWTRSIKYVWSLSHAQTGFSEQTMHAIAPHAGPARKGFTGIHRATERLPRTCSLILARPATDATPPFSSRPRAAVLSHLHSSPVFSKLTCKNEQVARVIPIPDFARNVKAKCVLSVSTYSLAVPATAMGRSTPTRPA